MISRGKQFHQDMSVMDRRYKEKWSPSVLAEFFWKVMRDASLTAFKQKATRPRKGIDYSFFIIKSEKHWLFVLWSFF